MSCLYEMDPRFLPTLLEADRMDVADGTWPPGGAGRNLPMNPDSRTIFIGLGGSGVRTLNQIKKEIRGRLQPGWERYVAFLAIDADWSELERAPYLTAEEFVCITRPDIKNTVEKGMAHYPNAWLPFVNEAKASEFIAFVGGDGACQRRLIGKMKLHYQAPGRRGVDEEIVARLEDVKTRLAPLNYGCDYEVYVIGSLCGGTGSGIVTELPALIHEALQIKNRTHIRSMFYLPDTLTALVTRDKEWLMANGYAALKELNYYQGLYMRPEGKEVFPWNGIGGALELNQRDGFYTLPTLVGTPHGATPEAMKIARDQVAEYLVNLLVDDNHIRMRFEGAALPGTPGKAANPQMEEAEQAFPKCYSAMGFAKAAIPEKMVRAYVMGQVCRNAGFLPVSDVERARLMAAGKNFLPFLGEKQYETATVVNAQCQEMLADLTRFIAGYHKGSFDYATVIPGGAPTWEAIHDGTADDAAVRNRISAFIAGATDSNAAQALENAVIGQFRAFRDSVKAYVQVNGPMAFYNLYHGCTVPEKGKLALGIREILRSMVDDINPRSGKPNFHANPDAKLQDKNQKDSEIRGQRAGIVDRVYDMLYGRRAMRAAEWEKLYNDAVNAAISARRRAYMLGRYGILKRCFLDPAEELCRQLWTFGKILETMSEACLHHGSQLEIQGAEESFAQVNIAGDHHALRYLQRQADIVAGQVDGQLVRREMVDSFFEDPEGWMEVEDKLIRRTGDAIGLKSEEMPVSARRKFDQCLKDTISVDMDMTIATLFENIKQDVQPEVFARDILNKLRMQSKPLFNGDLTGQYNLTYIMYPRSLSTSYPEVKDAIERQAKVMFGSNVGVYASDYVDSIMMYQMVAPFEIYRLKELKNWEKEYEVRKNQQANGLHGMSPDTRRIIGKDGNVTYEELTPWVDYPAITYDPDPQQEKNDGTKSYEGKVRDRLEAEIINKAMEMGLLYCEKIRGKYQVYSILLDKSVNWIFDINLLEPDAIGLYPTGADLLRKVMKMNKQDLKNLAKPVILYQGGQTFVSHSTEELAWFYAKKVLFADRQRLYRLRDAVSLVAPWNAAVDKANVDVLKKLKPGKMLRMMMARVYYPDGKQVWCMEKENPTKPVKIVSTAPGAIEFLDVQDPEMAAVVRAGFTLYYVYTELLRAKADMDAGLAYAKKILHRNANPVALQESVAKAQNMMREESEILADLGVDLAEPEQCLPETFIRHMAGLGISEETAADLVRFYGYLRLWRLV